MESRTARACRPWRRAAWAHSLGDLFALLEHASDFSKNEFRGVRQFTFATSCSLSSICSPVVLPSDSSGLIPAHSCVSLGQLSFGLSLVNFLLGICSLLRTPHTGEHLLLSYVRLQVAQAPPTAPASLRLLSWVQGYPISRAARQL
ncbi:hypothetical protein DFH11DRAFT_1231688 [Phellopilus nigrolimitatus]|nr:hypothetical protein DFH11DRAFT_197493 [Phellopilus nigrolimitatus]KAH8106614.1 hypothetical protein DFH11DRAFT_1231688 [Phellopilus nigrolimitatus]